MLPASVRLVVYSRVTAPTSASISDRSRKSTTSARANPGCCRKLDRSMRSNASCSGSSYGSGSSNTPLTTLKIAVLGPIPSASVKMTASANPGCLVSCRREKLMSRRMPRMGWSFRRNSGGASCEPRSLDPELSKWALGEAWNEALSASACSRSRSMVRSRERS